MDDKVLEKGETHVAGRPRLLDLVREAIRRLHYSRRTEQTYIHWIRRFIFFSGMRHPGEMGAVGVTAFLTSLATVRHVAASTQNQALAALLFLYKEIWASGLPWLDDVMHPKRPVRRPSVPHARREKGSACEAWRPEMAHGELTLWSGPAPA